MLCYFIILEEIAILFHSFCQHILIRFLCFFHRALMLSIWETVGLWWSGMGAPYSGPQCSNMISISLISWNVVVMVIYLVLVRYFPFVDSSLGEPD